MGQFQALYSQLTRQTPGIVNLYSIVINGKTNNLSAQRQVLEQKCHTCIQKLKEKADVGSPEELSFWLEASI